MANGSLCGQCARRAPAPGTGLTALRIPPQVPGWVGFDLAEVLAAVGTHADLHWVAWFNGDVTAVRPEGLGVQDRTRSTEGFALSWSEMTTLAQMCRQIIDAEFSGYSPSATKPSSSSPLSTSGYDI